MKLFDRIRAYLQEEDPSEQNEYEEAEGTQAEEPEEAGEVEEAEETGEPEETGKPEETEESEESQETGKPKRSKKSKRTKRAKKSKKTKKSRQTEDIDSEIDIEEIESVHASETAENERKMVQDFCEQLIDVSVHMEEAKKEYHIVTEYLSDIQRIEELPVEMANSLVDTASRIDRLDKDRQSYIQSENLLPVEQYNIFAAYDGEVIDSIKKLNDMEMRDSMLKSDMGHLEGEKEDLKFMRVEYADKVERLRGGIITILVLFLLTIGVLLAYALMTKASITLYALILGAVAMTSFAIFYVRYIDWTNMIRDTDAKVNRAISLLNKVKVKYINNMNAMDYIYAKYSVHSCKELEYQYEQYNIMVRDEQKYYQANNELRVLHEKLISDLTRIGVHDPRVWLNQVDAIVDRREMVEIRHGLIQRRQNLRSRMETCEKIRSNACTALRAAAAGNPGMERFIKELLSPHKVKVEN